MVEDKLTFWVVLYTFKVTIYCPGILYICEGFCWLLIPPSPKFQSIYWADKEEAKLAVNWKGVILAYPLLEGETKSCEILLIEFCTENFIMEEDEFELISVAVI